MRHVDLGIIFLCFNNIVWTEMRRSGENSRSFSEPSSYWTFRDKMSEISSDEKLPGSIFKILYELQSQKEDTKNWRHVLDTIP